MASHRRKNPKYKKTKNIWINLTSNKGHDKIKQWDAILHSSAKQKLKSDSTFVEVDVEKWNSHTLLVECQLE